MDLNRFITRKKDGNIMDIDGEGIRGILDLRPYDITECYCENNFIVKIICNENLRELFCSSNRISEIILNENLEVLACEFNNIKEIVCGKNLRRLFCKNNHIERIILNANLRELYCTYNMLAGVFGTKNLERFYCGNNHIEKIICGETLQVLHCIENDLKEIICNDSLKSLVCYNNKTLEIIRCFHRLDNFVSDITDKMFNNIISRITFAINSPDTMERFDQLHSDILEKDRELISNLVHYNFDYEINYRDLFKEFIFGWKKIICYNFI